MGSGLEDSQEGRVKSQPNCHSALDAESGGLDSCFRRNDIRAVMSEEGRAKGTSQESRG